jgi:hypothetical protein
MVGATAVAADHPPDHSVAIVDGGLNVYTISKGGVHLEAGSPFALPAWVLQAEGDPYPLTPASLSLNPRHDFVAVVYVLTPYEPDDQKDVIVVGYDIKEHGLKVKWTQSLNMDPHAYPLTTVSTGKDFTILLTAPDPGGPNFGYVIDNEGKVLVSEGSAEGSANELLSLRVDENREFYYSCRGDYGVLPAQTVAVYRLEPSPPKLILTSSDPDFIRSECQ